MTAGPIPRRRRWERGQTLLEFALMLPFLMLLSVGIVDVGRAIYYTIAINNAAAAGVEYGSRDGNTAVDYLNMRKSAQCDANGGSGIGGCTNGILPLANVTAVDGCTCDDGGTGETQTCIQAITNGHAGCSTDCGSGQRVQCVQVTTTATFEPLFHWIGLPENFTANGKAVMRVRK